MFGMGSEAISAIVPRVYDFPPPLNAKEADGVRLVQVDGDLAPSDLAEDARIAATRY